MKVVLPLLAMTSPTSIIVGLNGALQKRFILPEEGMLVPGNVHRAEQVQTGVGGKGQDVAIALNCLSPKSNLNLAQFIGTGSAGNAVFDLLVDTLGKSAMGLTVRVESEMRTCTSIVASDETTELVEPSGVITKQEQGELMNRLEETINNHAAGLCIMGSMPPGCAEDSYAQIYARSAGKQTLCIIDSVAGLEPLFKAISSMENSGPTLFKVNASELCNLAGCSKSKSETGGVLVAELQEAISQFLKRFSPVALNALTGLAITDGRHPGYYASLSESGISLFKLPIPVLKSGRTLFPIGAGDAVAAGTLAAWLSLTNRGEDVSFLSTESKKIVSDYSDSIGESEIYDARTRSILSAFAFGLACGSASKLKQIGFSICPCYFVDAFL